MKHSLRLAILAGLFASSSALAQQIADYSDPADAYPNSADLPSVYYYADHSPPTVLIANGTVPLAGSTFTRSSTATYFDATGTLQIASNNVLRLDHDITTLATKGFLIEALSSNEILHSRDFTNASWVKVNVTAAITQTGIDGIANSASLLTASAANGTVLQSLTATSQPQIASIYVKRITGTGNIQLTEDNGATWTTVVVTSGWTRVFINLQTLANPIVGVRIVTNGDAVAVDGFQLEPGVQWPTSVLFTTTAAVNRSADVWTFPTSSITNFDGTNGTIILKGIPTLYSPSAKLNVWTLSDGTLNNRILCGLPFGGTPGNPVPVNLVSVIAGVTQSPPGAGSANIVANMIQSTLGCSYQSTLNQVAVGSSVVTQVTTAQPAGTLLTVLNLGSRSDGAANFGGWISSFIYYPGPMSTTVMQRLMLQ